jgi:prolyl oligopeptidase
MAKGIVPPKIIMQRVPAQIRKQLVENPEQSLFYKPFANIPDHFAPVEKKRITSAAREVIREKVVRAYQKLYEFFDKAYLPACRESIGASELPNGRAYYEFRVRQFTTTEMTPDEIHQLGLNEVARIRKEMAEVINEVGFEGAFEEFIHFLRTDPQFYYDNAEELFEGYLAVAKRIDPQLVNLFGKLPRMPYGLKEIPEAIAPDTTTAYYTRPAADGSRAGYYYVNLYKPETRPKYEMEVLTVHESVPGHHLQIALQQELEQLPDFRRYSGFTVFVEGWGLYSERLGYELGLYKDPYSRFGQLTYDMWRAVRLVVDTGMHYKAWSRQKAIDYFLANAARQELDIVNEIDRYISWPGQALAYKLGQLKFLELRRKATNALGDKFDIRAFHDTVLGKGAVPLSVLEKMVDRWIEATLLEVE